MKKRIILGLLLSTLFALPSAADSFVNRQKAFQGIPDKFPWQLNTDGTWTTRSVFFDINPVTLGADPSGQTDSCEGITKALNAVPSGLSGLGGSVKFPQGTYVTSCWPTVTDKAISLAGSGNGPTQITFTSPSDAGLKFVYNATGLAPQIRDIALITVPSQTSNACITITRPAAIAAGSMPGPEIDNVNCSGIGTSYWADGVVCTYCNFLTVRRMHIVGLNTSGGSTVGTNNMNRGIYLDNSIDANISDLHIYFAKKGVSVDHDSEGLKLTSYSMVMVDWGVWAEDTWSAPGIVVAEGHINSTKGGIRIHGGGPAGVSTEAQIHDNLIYRWLLSTANPWVAFDCADGAVIAGTALGCTDHQFHHNNVIGFYGQGPTNPSLCFRLSPGTAQVQIQGNRCRQTSYFLDWGGSTASTIDVSGNAALGLGVGWFTGTPNPSATVHDNVPVIAGPNDLAAITVGLNATQWTLGGQNTTTFFTNASAATSVTDGFGGRPGLSLTVRCNDTNTTIVNGAGPAKFSLSGGSNFVCPRNGATISFTYSDQWREIGRTN